MKTLTSIIAAAALFAVTSSAHAEFATDFFEKQQQYGENFATDFFADQQQYGENASDVFIEQELHGENRDSAVSGL